MSSCASRYKTVINDYVVLPEGKEVVGGKAPLNAFIFETLTKPFAFQNFIMEKYRTDDLRAPEFWVTIDGSKYKVLVYDNNELEKYFHVSEFIQTNFDTNPDNNNRPKFIAVSMINEYNEDCLQENSLYYNVAVNFLKTLKQEYYKR
ncbi:hypothetical protein [Flavobacterium pallidum]|uniref:Uncharacterized protein n=1 Tax=Flavobacterium pallidum TaxID=2172098 RepID=A0A2S1SFB7_9FLAO|nr:hypothetical protein [Flavobacterium pallidum]AWI25106.1 hypothetical protein HYN49_03905 [Flavobacterium pallidum]